MQLPQEELDRITAYFAPPEFETGLSDDDAAMRGPDFANWVKTNVHKHKAPGYAIATITLKTPGQVPGDATADQMDAIADLMDQFSLGEVRVTHEQNLVLPHVREEGPAGDLCQAEGTGFRRAQCRADHRHHRLPGPGLLRPGQCPLDSDRAEASPSASTNLDRQHEIGELKIKISGCINACGHHHAGHIGILGVDKKGVEFYQLLLGGSGAEDASIGDIMGPGFRGRRGAGRDRKAGGFLHPPAPSDDEPFIAAFRRLGKEPFKEALYGNA